MKDDETAASTSRPSILDPRSSILDPRRPSTRRRLAELGVLAVCLLLILRQWGAEPYEVPTGSMAPALVGFHRGRDCPRCGYPVAVGRHPRDTGPGDAPARCYRAAACPN